MFAALLLLSGASCGLPFCFVHFTLSAGPRWNVKYIMWLLMVNSGEYLR